MPGFFDVLRVRPSLGRVLSSIDGPEAIVLSDPLWRSAFAADPSIVGRPIRLDGGTVTVVGIMPPRFDPDASFWVLLPSSLSGFRRDDRQFSVFARLATGSSTEDAARELSEISRRLSAEHPATNKDWTTFPTALRRLHGRDSRGAFILLQCAVGFVLLIACANIANILLARGTRRRHEMAVRVSLGATRGRLVRTLLTESLLLSLAGGILGVGLAMWGIRFARVVGGFPDVIDPTLNTVVLGFSASLAMLTGILSGIVPALRSSSISPETVLRADGRGSTSQSRGRLRAGLVAVQIACALVLAACGALMLRTFVNRARVDVGFDPRGAIRADLALPPDRYRDANMIRAVVENLLDHVVRNADVRAAGVSTWALPTGAGAQRTLTLPAERDTVLNPAVRRGIEAVTPGYFDALGAALSAGRPFADGDRDGAPAVAIVNDELARQLWRGRNPVGDSLRLGSVTENAPVVTVVGVVATIRRSHMHDIPVARVYVPFAQYPNGILTMVVRAGGNDRALRAAVLATDPSLLLEDVRTMEADLARFVAPIRLITWVLAGFGAVGLLLAGMGVFGTMSYTVSQRQHEMAVRSALGASRRDILGLVFRSALKITAIGTITGIAAALIATRALGAFLYGVSPGDPITLGVVVLFLTIVSLGACYHPASAAAAADPMALLRR
jgi:putative ABC transport system permease protein